MSHTHSSANANSMLTDVPGAELIKPYLAQMTDATIAAIPEDRRGAFLAARLGVRPGEVRALNAGD